jgi:hypothetical protein
LLPPQRRRSSFGLGWSPTTFGRGWRIRRSSRLLGILDLSGENRRRRHRSRRLRGDAFLHGFGRTLGWSQHDRTLDQLGFEIVAALETDAIGFDDVRLPFPEEMECASFTDAFPDFAETPLAEGVAATVDRFRTLLAAGLVQPPDQGAT